MMVAKESINYQRIEQAIEYLGQNFKHQPNLDEVAEKVHISPFHFQRIFSEWAGISPKRFIQFLTVNFLKKKLLETENLNDAAESAGLSTQSRVYDLFTTLEAVTPQEYKLKGSGIKIDYGFHETPFGSCLIGITGRGVCWLSFLQSDQDPETALETLKHHWLNSTFQENSETSAVYIRKIFYPDRAKADNNADRLHIFVKGTNFQIKVWEALLKIPMGNLTTYQHIAKSIDNPQALQAVGSAVGSNHIAYLIPCHRVIRKEGILGEYRWTPIRKKIIIGWEMVARYNNP